MRHLHFLVNSQAGRGRAQAAWLEVKSYLTSRGYSMVSGGYSAHSASRSMESREYSVSDAVDSTFDFSQLPRTSILVALGGDGSIHYAATTAVTHGFTLGIIPAGTGNDFASALGIPPEPLQALQTILSGQTKMVDVIKANNQFIFNAGGFGLDASVVHFIEANPWLKRRGSLGYSLSLPIVLGRFQPFSMTLRGERQEQGFKKVSLVAVTNGPSFGGGMKLVPTANLFDGRIEVCVVDELPKPELLRVFPRIFKGTHVTHPCVHIYQGERFEVEFARKRNYGQYDGEPIETTERVNIEVMPRQLQILL